MRVVLLCSLLAFLNASPALAQGNPSDFGRSAADEVLKYYARVQKEVYEDVLLRWRAAATEDDVVALAGLYAPKASYYPPATSLIQTRGAIRDHFAKLLPMIGSVSVGLIDFGISGDLAYITARVGYRVLGADGQSREVTRTDLILARRNGRNEWLIQTHLSREELDSKARD